MDGTQIFALIIGWPAAAFIVAVGLGQLCRVGRGMTEAEERRWRAAEDQEQYEGLNAINERKGQ